MTLRSRIALALLVITLILVAPAVYAVGNVRTLREIAETLRTRVAAGALALGRMQTEFGELEQWQRIVFALAEQPDPPESARARVIASLVRFGEELDNLDAAGYDNVTPVTRQRLQAVRDALDREWQLINARQFEALEPYREEFVVPSLVALRTHLTEIGTTINRMGEQEAQRAQALAATAVTTALTALLAALGLAILISGLLTSSILRPIIELRRGMSAVAGGDFDPHLRIRPDRPDELGDLARSFDRMTRQLAEFDRLKAEFISVASHELKTPLSVIKGYVSLLLEGIYGTLSPEQTKVLGSVSEQSDRLGRLIQQLLDISRFEAGGGRLELRPVELRPFLAELTTSFEALAIQNQIDFELEIEEDLPGSVVGDPDRLNEVVGNLLSNAFKFTPRDGAIRLRAGAEPDAVVIEVVDNGIGIPEAQLPRIFEKFYQVENRVLPLSIGSGLGLAIAREIVEAHGGTITADSVEGEGTTFRVHLPRNGSSA